MAETRALVVGAVGLVKVRLKGDGYAALAARNQIEPHLVSHGFLIRAPFKTVSLVLRYGADENLNPEIGPVDRPRSMLPVAVQLSAEQLKLLDSAAMTAKFRDVMIDVLRDVAANFDLPFAFLDDLAKNSGS